MKRLLHTALQWLLPVLIVAEIFLVWGDVLDTKAAIGIVIGIGISLLLVGGSQIIRVIRRDRAQGRDVWAEVSSTREESAGRLNGTYGVSPEIVKARYHEYFHR